MVWLLEHRVIVVIAGVRQRTAKQLHCVAEDLSPCTSVPHTPFFGRTLDIVHVAFGCGRVLGECDPIFLVQGKCIFTIENYVRVNVSFPCYLLT